VNLDTESSFSSSPLMVSLNWFLIGDPILAECSI
jgi:hypothetical protein